MQIFAIHRPAELKNKTTTTTKRYNEHTSDDSVVKLSSEKCPKKRIANVSNMLRVSSLDGDDICTAMPTARGGVPTCHLVSQNDAGVDAATRKRTNPRCDETLGRRSRNRCPYENTSASLSRKSQIIAIE